MLAYVLALVIGLGSIAIYMAAFFFPEVHRKNDFIWSGVGLFYALVLWVCAGRITGGVLLGQMASVALIGWFSWQTLTLRRELIPPEQQTAVPSQDELQTKLKSISLPASLQKLPEQLTGLFRKGKSEAQTATLVDTPAPEPSVETRRESELNEAANDVAANDVAANDAAPLTSTNLEVEVETAQATEEATDSESSELIRPNPPDPELVEAAQNSAPSDASELSQEATTAIEAIAPEVEMAPPAEPPGPGDPEDRLAAPDAAASIEVVPIDPENPPAQT
jgi:hypothetical protein